MVFLLYKSVSESIRKKTVHVGHLPFEDKTGMAKVTLSLTALLRQDVALKGLAPQNLPGSGNLKALIRTPMGLKFWHWFFLRLVFSEAGS